MVMPNADAPKPEGTPHPPDRSTAEPAFLALVAVSANVMHAKTAALEACRCPQCLLLAKQARVSAFLLSETLRAAVTGDTTGLDLVLAKVAQVQAKT
ncbi:hypothetical protein C1280_15165 [Gemmata obscuriglobus]|uniref:Uncharacterized protein n=2 Tax=Gemmata obscuriglobus TaxID=114 RepID=A0A2Z3H016_9BACT|nr:hypothetical protein C1280_15165 [Gemmata obscuriglobus]